MEDNINQKNINEKWLDLIFESLKRLQSFETLMREGCASVFDFAEDLIKNNNVSLDKIYSLIEYKNYQLFLSEIEMLSINIENSIEKKDLKEIRLKINGLKEFEIRQKGFLFHHKNEVENTIKYSLKPSFLTAKKEISKLRGLIINSLWKILSPNAKENFEGLPR